MKSIDRKGWNWAPVPFDVITSDKLNHADVRVYAYLLFRAGKKDYSWPSVETIATDLHMSTSAVKLAFRRLIQNDWMRRHRQMKSSSITYIFETQKECRAFSRSHHRLSDVGITGDTTVVSQVVRVKDNHIKDNQLKTQPAAEVVVETPLSRVLKAYDANMRGDIVPFILDDIKSLMDDDKIPEQWFMDAMKITAASGSGNWRYCKTILNRWRVNGRDDPAKPKKSYAPKQESKNAGW